jgi:acyl transferase domain-containing protein/thioesterase domain-containing protein/acyl carrier protein
MAGDDLRSQYTPAEPAESDIAIVGMAGRFPGAPTVDDLWRRVEAGEDCLVELSREALLAAGVPESALDDPSYVRRNGVLDDVDAFDAGFFNVGQRDAAIMDPQHRHFIECCWEALETSGHVPERFAGAIGVFAGCGMNTYMLNNLLTNPQLVEQVGMFLLRHTANDKDFLATTVSYKLDLRGPSVNVQTACSTSLVAVHLAVQSLLSFECDLALAGGVTIEVPHGVGYHYQEGEVLSPDGVCRAFDERSAGTVLTSGAGVVALRRLADAIEDGDEILAVVKATAINNDGQRKVGYLAPSVDGHADVVKEALAVAGLSARDIQLLEAHGTGTAVGDPIEVAALTEAFRASTPDTGFCRLVSTKPNIGHLDTAAGVASLIKVVQALRHRTLPPLANHTAPSPLLDLSNTPFVISAEPAAWPGDRPRRAGVSSLGVGGTNAHVIVEEAPQRSPAPPSQGEHVLAFSARDAETLGKLANRLADHLEREPGLDIGDVAHTLATRRVHAHRRVVVAPDTETAVQALRSNDRNRVATTAAPDTPPRVAFMFPGGGSQYNGMAAGLDDRFEVFHEVMRDGIERVRRRSGIDLAPLLRPDAEPDALIHTPVSLPAIFITSVAMARQWMAWGVNPSAFVGHSLGEYAAAHLAGVLTFDGALELIVGRAALIDRVSGSGAAMLAVPLPADEVARVLPAELSIATVNADDECVVAGPTEIIEAFAAEITTEEVRPTVLHLAAAGHSAMLDPILPEFLEIVQRVELSPPQVPYLSNLTGTWITAEQATSPQYWVDHLRHTVRFTDCLRTLLADGPTVLVEVGPGHSLSSYARRQEVKPVAAIPVLRHPNQQVDDTAYSIHAFARAWAAGVDVSLERFTGEGRHVVRLPGYPFRRDRHWIAPGAGRISSSIDSTTTTAAAAAAPASRRPTRITDIAEEFWVPTWTDATSAPPASAPVGPWLLVASPDDPLAAAIARELTDRGEAVEVTPSPRPAALSAARSVVLVGPSGSFDQAADLWLTWASAAARELGPVEGAPTLLAAVTRSATGATGPAGHPEDAMALGVVGTAPREYPGLRTLLVDLDTEGDTSGDARAVVRELFEASDRVVARRGLRRLVPGVERSRLDAANESRFRRGGTYMVTGGLGGVGFALATHLARDVEANLVVVASRPVPEGAARSEWLARHGYDDPTSRRLRRLAELESYGTKVTVVTADLADPASVRAALDEAERLVGHIDGAIHAAGELRDKPIELATREDHEVVVGAKARGALALAEELRRRNADLLVLISSTSTFLQADGQASYVAANAVLDSLAGTHGTLEVRTINYGLWSELGIASTAAHRSRLGIEPGRTVHHPVLSEVATDRDGTIRFVGTLMTDHHWVVDEHRSATGVALLPGTGHVELLLSALAMADIDGSPRDIVLLEPLVVPDGKQVTVRVSIGPAGAPDGRTLQVESDGGGGDWRLHSEGRVAEPALAPVDLPAPQRPTDAVDVDPLARPASQLELGPRWSSVDVAWRDGDEIAGRLRLAEPYAAQDDAWRAHPGLVDVATAFGVTLGEQADALYVPIGYDAIRWAGPLPADPWVIARRQDSSTDELLKVDLHIGAQDAVLLTLEGLTLRPIADPTALAVEEPAAAPPTTSHRVPPLVALAAEHGIRADEGAELLERVLASGRPRVVASSLDLDDLVAMLDTGPAAAEPSQGAADAAPGNSVLATIRSIWVDLLGVADIGDDDDFFEAGGHSLIAIRLMSRIHKELGVRFQLATIFDAPTISRLTEKVLEVRPDLDRELAAAAQAASATVKLDAAPAATPAAPATAPTTPPATVAAAPAEKPAHQSLVTISPTGDKAPLFIVHGAGGNILFLWSLARAMAGSRPIYGFQAIGVDGQDMPDPTIEAMAQRYVRELTANHRGPYILGGYSGGGIVTFEMVRQLRELGEEVRFVVLFDSVPPGKAAPSGSQQLRNLLANIRRHGLDPMQPYIKARVRHSLSRVIPRFAERQHQLEADERDLGVRDVEDLGFVNLFYYFSAAAEKYRMGTIDVDAAVLKAEWVWPVQPHDYYWGAHIRGDLDIREVPGDHNAMFLPENAPRLAAVLDDVLDAHGL